MIYAETEEQVVYLIMTSITYLSEEVLWRSPRQEAAVGYAVNRGNSKDPWMQGLLEMIAEASRVHHFVLVAVHVDRRFNQLADLCTRFQVLDDFSAVLPPGVEVGDVRWRKLCRNSSPASSSVVFSLPLRLSAGAA